jgi:hypothetical protein
VNIALRCEQRANTALADREGKAGNPDDMAAISGQLPTSYRIADPEKLVARLAALVQQVSLTRYCQLIRQVSAREATDADGASESP